MYVSHITLTAETYLTVSAEPREPAAVENRRNTGVSLSGVERKSAPVILDQSPCETKVPWAPAPRAWAARSGTRS
jgi:hypothetical protein